MTTLYTSDLSRIQIGPAVVPGVVTSIKIPQREINWQVQMAVAGVGAATIYRGTKLIEAIEIESVLAVPGRPQNEWDQAPQEWLDFLRVLWPNPPAKPPAFNVDHPLFRMVYPAIATVAYKASSCEATNANGTAWRGKLVLIEYRPLKIIRPAAPDPAKLDNRDKPPQDAVEKELQDLLNKARNA